MFDKSIVQIRNDHSGFTLIEIIMVVAIMAMMTGGAINAYSYFNSRQQLIQSAKNIQLLLREAQKRSRVGDKPSTGCVVLQGYRVQASAGASTINLYAVCSNSLNPGINVGSVDLVGEVTLTNAENVMYKVLTGGITGTGNIDVQVSSTNKYRFDVSAGGEISEGDYVSN